MKKTLALSLTMISLFAGFGCVGVIHRDGPGYDRREIREERRENREDRREIREDRREDREDRDDRRNDWDGHRD